MSTCRKRARTFVVRFFTGKWSNCLRWKFISLVHTYTRRSYSLFYTFFISLWAAWNCYRYAFCEENGDRWKTCISSGLEFMLFTFHRDLRVLWIRWNFFNRSIRAWDGYRVLGTIIHFILKENGGLLKTINFSAILGAFMLAFLRETSALISVELSHWFWTCLRRL